MEELGAGEVVGGMVDVYCNEEENLSRVPFEAGEDQCTSWNRPVTRKKCLDILQKIELDL